jgi:hypothetical protein
MTGLLVTNVILIMISLSLIFYYLKKKFYLAVAITILTSYLVLISSTIRPHVVSWIFLLLTIIIIKKGKEWLLPFLILIWGNIHPLHLVGLVIIGIYLGIKWAQTKEKRYMYIIGICGIAATINHSGIKTFLIPFIITFSHINEWQPFSPAGQYFWIYTGVVAVAIYLFTRKSIFDKEYPYADALVCLTLIILGYISRRHVAQFFIIGIPLLIVNLNSKLEYDFLKTRTKKRDIIWVLLIIILILFNNYDMTTFNTTYDWNILPSYEVQLIQEYNIKGNVFNNYGYGCFLEFYLYPHNLMYIDSRAETMGQELLTEYYELGTTKKQEIFKVLERDNVTIVIVRHAMGLTNALLNSQEWKLVYLDETRASFVLRTNETENVPEIDLKNNPYIT